MSLVITPGGRLIVLNVDDSPPDLYTFRVNLLGKILVDQGAISVAELYTGLEACKREGTRLGSCLVGYGFISENSLLEALAQQHGVPFVTESMLRQLRSRMGGSALPEDLQRSLKVVPFRKVRDRIQVAMRDPADIEAIERISAFTQMHVEPFVASDRTISRTLEQLDNEKDLRPAEEVPAHGDADRDESGWERLWSVRVDPSSLLRARGRARPPGKVLIASFPALLPVAPERGKPAPTRRDDGVTLLMESGRTVNEVADLLVRHSAQRLDRVCLFSLHRGRIAGWMSRGVPLDAVDVRSFSVYADAPSVFLDVDGRDRYVGPIHGGPVNDELLKVLGEPRPTEVALIPIPVMGRVKGYLMGDLQGRRLAASVLHELIAAAQAAGNALGRLLAKR